jgi:hypothetical protein
MSITEERLQLFNNSARNAPAVDVTDLYTNEGDPGGTRVNIYISVRE